MTSLLKLSSSNHKEPRKLVWGIAEKGRTENSKQPFLGEDEFELVLKRKQEKRLEIG